MNATLEINADIKNKLHDLAQKTHRTENELANDVLSAFIDHDSYVRAEILIGLNQANRREFASDAEMEAILAATKE
jgi:predicted transcriptional regulator